MSWKLVAFGIAVVVTSCAGFDCVPLCVQDQGDCVEGNVCECNPGFTGANCGIALKIKVMQAVDDEMTNENDKLTIICEGDSVSGGKFHLQLQQIGAIFPWTKELEGGVPVQIGTDYYITFPYTLNGASADIKELLTQKFTILLEIKDQNDEKELASASIGADLTDVSGTFPSNIELQYVSDSEVTANRWIRVDTVDAGPFTGGPTTIPKCTAAVCYTYEPSFDVATEFSACIDVGADGTPTDLQLCSSEGSAPTDIALKDDEVTGNIILDHAGKLEVTLTESKSAVTIDLIVHKTSAQPVPSIPCTGITVGADAMLCPDLIIEENTEEYKILLVGYDISSAVIWTKDYTSKNHDLTATILSAHIIEASWDHTSSVGTEKYKIQRNEKTGEETGGYTTAYVDCTAISDKCNSYFVDVPIGGTYQVTLQNIITLDPNGAPTEFSPVSVRSKDAAPPSLQKKTIIIHEESSKTRVIDENIIAEVCFEHLKNISTKNVHYEFLVVNSKGQWKKETEVNMKSDSYACFNSMELPLADFKENTKSFVLLRDSQNGNILASEEVKLRVLDSVVDRSADPMETKSDNTVWIIVGASAGVLTCLVALIAVIHTKFIRRSKNKDGIQYPLHRANVENSIVHGLDNPVSTM